MKKSEVFKPLGEFDVFDTFTNSTYRFSLSEVRLDVLHRGEENHLTILDLAEIEQTLEAVHEPEAYKPGTYTARMQPFIGPFAQPESAW